MPTQFFSMHPGSRLISTALIYLLTTHCQYLGRSQPMPLLCSLCPSGHVCGRRNDDTGRLTEGICVEDCSQCDKPGVCESCGTGSDVCIPVTAVPELLALEFVPEFVSSDSEHDSFTRVEPASKKTNFVKRTGQELASLADPQFLVCGDNKDCCGRDRTICLPVVKQPPSEMHQPKQPDHLINRCCRLPETACQNDAQCCSNRCVLTEYFAYKVCQPGLFVDAIVEQSPLAPQTRVHVEDSPVSPVIPVLSPNNMVNAATIETQQSVAVPEAAPLNATPELDSVHALDSYDSRQHRPRGLPILVLVKNSYEPLVANHSRQQPSMEGAFSVGPHYGGSSLNEPNPPVMPPLPDAQKINRDIPRGVGHIFSTGYENGAGKPSAFPGAIYERITANNFANDILADVISPSTANERCNAVASKNSGYSPLSSAKNIADNQWQQVALLLLADLVSRKLITNYSGNAENTRAITSHSLVNPRQFLRAAPPSSAEESINAHHRQSRYSDTGIGTGCYEYVMESTAALTDGFKTTGQGDESCKETTRLRMPVPLPRHDYFDDSEDYQGVVVPVDGFPFDSTTEEPFEFDTALEAALEGNSPTYPGPVIEEPPNTPRNPNPPAIATPFLPVSGPVGSYPGLAQTLPFDVRSVGTPTNEQMANIPFIIKPFAETVSVSATGLEGAPIGL